MISLFNRDKKVLKDIEKSVKPVLALEDKMRAMSDEELKNQTVLFKERLANGETLDDIMVEAFATCREVAKRVNNEFPFFCQLEGALVLHRGDIAEMKTGEGKTLTSALAVYLNALSGHGVHVITVNDYLAERDSIQNGRIYEFLGLTVGFNHRGLTPQEKKAAYNCDVTYTTNSELGFDYLRDNMVTKVEDRVLRELNFALVDEVDSILIDESRTPLIISGGQKSTVNEYENADRLVKSLKKKEDYKIDLKERDAHLTEKGITKAEKFYHVDNIYDAENCDLVHFIKQALQANYILKKDVDYVVEDGEVIIVDPNTGRKMPGREWNDGLHQAVQAKEGLNIRQESITLATITYQNFFRLYNKLAGMTGTAKTEEEEFLSIYNMRVVEIPTNRPVIRKDEDDLIFATKKAKYKSLINEIKALHQKGQPVLVGTIAVETSELLSEMLKKAGIPHEVLNAKNHAREAEIIAKAGLPGQVTIATNMAGRGTDIKLTEESKALGGLCVLGSERHESRRIDNQLRGRSGRQGDPGRSQFYVSLQDDLMIRFGNKNVRDMFKQMGDDAIKNKTLTKAINGAQARVEGMNFDMRKTLLDYDDVLRQQRETMYAQRNYILENENIHEVIRSMFERLIEDAISQNIDEKERIDYEGLEKTLKGYEFELENGELNGEKPEEIEEKLFKKYEEKAKKIANIENLERTVCIKTIDRAWTSHIDIMAKLRDGIHLRSYAQNNPLQAYVEEGYNLFEEMMYSISRDVVMFCNKLKVITVVNNAPKELAK